MEEALSALSQKPSFACFCSLPLDFQRHLRRRQQVSIKSINNCEGDAGVRKSRNCKGRFLSPPNWPPNPPSFQPPLPANLTTQSAPPTKGLKIRRLYLITVSQPLNLHLSWLRPRSFPAEWGADDFFASNCFHTFSVSLIVGGTANANNEYNLFPLTFQQHFHCKKRVRKHLLYNLRDSCITPSFLVEMPVLYPRLLVAIYPTPSKSEERPTSFTVFLSACHRHATVVLMPHEKPSHQSIANPSMFQSIDMIDMKIIKISLLLTYNLTHHSHYYSYTHAI